MRPSILLLSFVLIQALASAQSSKQTSLQQEWEAIRTRMYERQDSLTTLYNSITVNLATATDTTLKKELEYRLHQLNNAIEQNRESMLQHEFDLVKQHPSSPIALDVLSLEFNRQEGKPYETFLSLFNSLSHEQRNSEKGKQLQEALFHCNNSTVGKLAPGFTLKDIDQETVSLKAYQNKAYVLLDFWASWCVPCRQDFPLLKQAFAKYHSNGLEIINVSTDQDLVAWKKAITTDSIDMWKHVSDKENNSTLATRYFVTGIPVKVLIDKQGKIIGRWRGRTKENEEALLQMLQSIFE